jgi:hypothetical protein
LAALHQNRVSFRSPRQVRSLPRISHESVKRDGTVAAAVGGVWPEANVQKALELAQKMSGAR